MNPYPRGYSDAELAPLLCAGIIGYRALKRADLPPGGRLGLYGFGGSAHLAAQVALAQGATLYVMTRGSQAQELARSLGAAFVGGPTDMPPEPLDADEVDLAVPPANVYRLWVGRTGHAGRDNDANAVHVPRGTRRTGRRGTGEWCAGCRYGAGMAFSLARSAHNATNSLHSLIYFVPETDQHLTGVGLRAGRMCYFAGRAAPMGAVGSGVVTATFYNFSPGLVARSIPMAWELASPDVVIGARFAAADAALTRLLGPDAIASADMITMAALVRDAVRACSAEGRPLYAGHADLSWPDAPHLVMWHAVSLLREHRGDGHTCALAAAGLNGIEALVTHTATGKGFAPEFARASRGWRQAEWDSAVTGLAARGLLDSQGALTSAGHALRAQVEDETDRMAAPPWRYLGDRRTEDVVRIGKAMTQAVVAAGAFPREGVFATR